MSTDQSDPQLSRWFYKSVPFSWKKVEFEFSLSHALFSSDRIDDGSKALLSVLASETKGITGGRSFASPDTPASPDRSAARAPRRVYDMGCGTGVLGIVAGKTLHADEIILEDRDSLAVSLATLNASYNGVEDLVSPSARPTGTAQAVGCEFVLCNLPAKAGESVQRLMLAHGIESLGEDAGEAENVAESGAGGGSAGGLFLVVVVNTLAEYVGRVLTELGATAERHAFRGHTVFTVRRASSGAPTDTRTGADLPLPDAYRGEKRAFTQGSVRYHLTTIHGLGEFESPSFTNRMLTRLTAERCAGRNVLLFESGPGHVCTALQSLPRGSGPASIAVSARNTLAGLAATGVNSKWRDTHTFHLCERPMRLAEYLEPEECVVLPLDPEPYTPLLEETAELASHVSAVGGTLIVAGRSGVISQFERHKHPLSITRKTRSRGIRGLVLDSKRSR